MKVTLNWLKQYVDFDWSPDELAERLTMLGLEVEGVEKLGGEFEGIVVAQVITREKHPNADKLSLCRVNDGRGERQIVCGAQNFKAGDKVPLITPGASLPMKPGENQPFTIKVGKIRGVESQGMMCSPMELGLTDDADGLLILPDSALVGQPFAEHLGRAGSDVVYDLEVTPNRPDLNSVIGIAREISAATGNPLKLPDCGTPGEGQGSSVASELVAVRLEAPEHCPRYTARVVQGVKIGPSPAWLRNILEKLGHRSINNVVDVTNYVMLEAGQPLHAFDYHLIGKSADGKPTIVVRPAADGEKFTTLDEQERVLTGEMLLIADEQRGIALAGVMGGLNTEINEATVDVLIESANFSPANIRRTSKALSLRSESSYRFERGCDIGICDWASLRCAQLILETAGGRLAQGIVEAYPSPAGSRQVTLRPQKVTDLLGIAIDSVEITNHLQKLGLKKIGDGGAEATGSATFQIPSFRVDLKREVDLIEEVIRLHGVDRIPASAPRGAVGNHSFDTRYDELGEVRRLLAGIGLDETQGQTLVSRSETSGSVESSVIALANPLSSEMDVLRPSLIPGLLAILHHNVTRKNQELALFEVGRTFQDPGTQPKEERRVAIVLTGQRQPTFWNGTERDAKFDASDLKGVVEEFIERLGLRGISYTRNEIPSALFIESATVSLGGKLMLGELGQLHPKLARAHDLRDPVFVAELRLDELLARRAANKSFKSLPQFPGSRRDLAMIVAEEVTHDAVLSAVKKAKPQNLESVELFDVFRGKHVEAGHKSLAYAFTYRSSDKTLTEQEVNGAHDRVMEACRSELKAVVRE